MAAGLLLRRFSFHLCPKQSLISLPKGPSLPFPPSPNVFLGIDRLGWIAQDKRGIQTNTKSTTADEDAVCYKTDTNSSEPVSDSVKMLDPNGNLSHVKFTALSNLKTSKRHDLAMIFTCKVCETRSVKTACRESYEKGVVVARCGGCNNLHLIADRLGWFGEPGSVEDFLAARGEEVKKGSLDTLNLTAEELVGR
eukprot:TRINITY_DN1228_c0_g1_i1.p1 TRINITY_DN1228_c0_g1~~TRINITY_DN1228_c0_g1_i1.p1  ORF type:complete len:210 (+),score=26.18 TRINITY_DN1228_c0_g1_i1:48-632(+)